MKPRRQDWGSWWRAFFRKDVSQTMLFDSSGSDRWVWSGLWWCRKSRDSNGKPGGSCSNPGSYLWHGLTLILETKCYCSFPTLEPHLSKHFHCLQLMEWLEYNLFSDNFFGFQRENRKTLINTSTRTAARTIPKMDLPSERKRGPWFMP